MTKSMYTKTVDSKWDVSFPVTKNIENSFHQIRYTQEIYISSVNPMKNYAKHPDINMTSLVTSTKAQKHCTAY